MHMGLCQSNKDQLIKMKNRQMIIDNRNLKLKLEQYNSKNQLGITNLQLAKHDLNCALNDLSEANNRILTLEKQIDQKTHDILEINQNLENQTQIIKDKTEQIDQNIEINQQLQLQLIATKAALGKKKPSFLKRTFSMKS